MRWWSSDGWFLWNSTSLILFDNVNVTWCERVHGNNQTACVGPLCKEWHWTKTRPGAHSNWQVSEVWEYGKCITHQQWDFSWDMMGIYPGRYHQKQNDTFIWAYQLSLTFPRFRTLDIGNLVNESLSQDVTTKVQDGGQWPSWDFWGPCEAAIRLPAALQATLRVNSNLEALFAPVKPWDRNHVDLLFTWPLDTIWYYMSWIRTKVMETWPQVSTSIYEYLQISSSKSCGLGRWGNWGLQTAVGLIPGRLVWSLPHFPVWRQAPPKLVGGQVRTFSAFTIWLFNIAMENHHF